MIGTASYIWYNYIIRTLLRNNVDIFPFMYELVGT